MDVCTGCGIPACLTVAKIDIIQLAPLPIITQTAAATRKHITWQGGTPGCTGATPTRNRTWGAIKAIYR
jgi:hypothetical protein